MPREKKLFPVNPSPRLQQSLLLHPEENATGYTPFKNALDKENAFKPTAKEWSRVNAWWLADASWLAYSHDTDFVAKVFADNAGMPACAPLRGKGTQGYIAHNGTFAIVTFRGTQPDEWRDLFDIIRLIPTQWDIGFVHQGFADALDAVWPQLEAELDRLPASCEVWFTGHSLGGALASLASLRRARQGRPATGVYTIGSPRVGDASFAGAVGEKFEQRSIRYVNDHDVVTHVPPEGFALPRKYTHVDSLRSINSAGQISDARPRLDHFFRDVFGDNPFLLDVIQFLQNGLSINLPDSLSDHTPLYYALHIWNDLVANG
jgi:triacylglycerol lipase